MTFWDGTRWVNDAPATPTRPSRSRRFLGAAAEAGLITALTFGLIAGTTFAGKGGNGGGGRNSGSLSLVVLAPPDVNYGEDVTFDVTSSASHPYVNVRCYQGAAFVYDGWAGFYSGAWFGQTFTLSGPSWSGGAADCTARLVSFSKNGRERTLDSTQFRVGE
jgi:hypothetical protein